METHTLIRDKLSEWNLREFIQRFEDEQIDYETFLILDTSNRLEALIPKTGPRVKFRKRLQEYRQSLNRQHTDEVMDTNLTQEDNTEMLHQQSTPTVPVCDNDTSTETFFPTAAVTQEQCILATQLFILRHRLPTTARGDLMTLFKSIIPNFSDDSEHVFNKIKVNKRECNELGSFFLFSSLKDLLKDTLKSHNMKLLPKIVNRGDKINDIMDGKIYQNLMQQRALTDDDITLLWNCDGVPVQQHCIWPLQFTINELPYQIRKQKVLVAGLWCGLGDPDMETFLMPFIDECRELAQEPLKWIDSNGAVSKSRVFLLVCSSDAVARPLLRNCKRFNGEFGCDWCLHSGTMVDKGSGKMRSYTYDEKKQEARCKKMFRDDASRAEKSGKPVNGVKGLCALHWLPLFDIVHGFVPEYSHSVLLGVCRQIVFLWLEPENSSQPWYLGNKVDELDQRLLGLKPDLKIARSPISLKCRESWKAVDWQAFLLFYGIYVVQPFLSPQFLQHFHILSCSVHILLQNSVTEDDLNTAHADLVRFVKDMERLYGEENVTFNCHQLIHLCESVRNWGPLWATSALGFERNNKDLQALLSDVPNNPEHITEKFCIWQHIPNHLKSLVFSDLDFSRLLNPVSPPNHGNISYSPYGNACYLHFEDSVKLALQNLLKKAVRGIKAYERFTNGHTIYHCANSKDYDQTKCIIKQKNGCYGEIHLFLDVKTHCMCTCNCSCPTSPVIVAKMFDTSPFLGELDSTKPARTIFVKGKRTEQLKALFIHDIRSECVNVNGCIVPIPNTHERY